MKSLYNYIFENERLEDHLINLYRRNSDGLSRHSKVHLMTRGNLINMFPRVKMVEVLKDNAETLSDVLDNALAKKPVKKTTTSKRTKNG